MSNQQLPVIKNLREGLQKEAIETGKKLRKSLGQQSKSSAKKYQQATTNVQQNNEQPKVVIDQGKIFSKKPSIFSVKSQNKNIGNIFANRKSVNLFNLNSQASNQKPLNIFSLATNSQPVIKNQLEDDLLSQSSLGPEDNEADQNLKQPEQRIMRYAYDEKMEKLGEFRVTKFKNGGETTKEGVLLLSLEKQKQGKSNRIYLNLRTQATKITIYQSILLPNTKLEHFLNREQNFKFWTVRSKKQEENVVLQRQIVKIQFENLGQAKRFEQMIESEFPIKAE